MGVEGAVVLVSGVLLALINAIVTRVLWASSVYDRSQKIAQTVLISLVPLGAFVVWNVLRPAKGHGGASAFNLDDVPAWIKNWVQSDGAHHGGGAFGHHGGGDGGHHGGGDGGHDGGGGFGGHH